MFGNQARSAGDVIGLFGQQAAAEFCERNHILKLTLFGSVLRDDDFGPTSDVDVLVEFDPSARVGLLKKAAIQNDLSELIGRRVDLRTLSEISPYIRQRVIQSAQVQYVRR